MSKVSQVLAEVAADLTARGVPVEVVRGKTHLAHEHAGNRIVYYRADDGFGAPNLAGGNPRPILRCAAGVRLHIWGVSFQEGATPEDHEDVAESLRDQFLLSLHRKAGASRLGYEANTGSFTDAGENVYGAEYVLNVTLSTPVVDEPWPEVESVEAQNISKIKVGDTDEVACGGI